MKKLFALLTSICLVIAMSTTAGCERAEDAGEEAADAVGEAVEETGDAVEEMGDEVDDAM